MPTSEIRTHASITMPLSNTRSSTSIRLDPPDTRSMAIEGLLYPRHKRLRPGKPLVSGFPKTQNRMPDLLGLGYQLSPTHLNCSFLLNAHPHRGEAKNPVQPNARLARVQQTLSQKPILNVQQFGGFGYSQTFCM